MSTVSPMRSIAEGAQSTGSHSRQMDPSKRMEDEAYDMASQSEAGAEHPSRVPSGDDTRLVKVPRQVAVGNESLVGIGIKFIPNEHGEMVVTSLMEGGPADQSQQGWWIHCITRSMQV